MRAEARLFWGGMGASCPECYKRWLNRPVGFEDQTVVAFFNRRPKCSICSDTRRDPVPWAELFKDTR